MSEKRTHIGMFINTYVPGDDDIELFVIQCSVVVMGICFNVTVIFLFLCISRLRSVQGIFYVFNLSVANFFFSLSILVISTGSKFEMLTSTYICKLASGMTNFLCIIASVSRFIIAADRFRYIDDPLHYYNRSSEAAITRTIICGWAGCFCGAFTPYVPEIYKDTFSSPSIGDTCLPWPSKFYEIFMLVALVVSPMFYELFVYSKIYYWAYMHLKIMKQEANYSNVLRQRSVKESYNVDLKQLELFTRASLLMASTIFAIKNEDVEEVEQQSEHPEPESSFSVWGHTFRRVTLNSNLGSYISSLLKFGAGPKIDAENGKDEVARRHTFTSFGSAIDKALSRDDCYTECETITVSETNDSLNIEDMYIEEEMRRLSRKVEAKGFKAGSKALYGAITALLTRTELKALSVFFLMLLTIVGLWLYFLYLSVHRFLFDENTIGSRHRKAANICVYGISCMDPIIYDLFHQPIRNTVRDEIKNIFKHRNCV